MLLRLFWSKVGCPAVAAGLVTGCSSTRTPLDAASPSSTPPDIRDSTHGTDDKLCETLDPDQYHDVVGNETEVRRQTRADMHQDI